MAQHADGRVLLELDSVGARQNVHISIEDVTHAFGQNLAPRLVDLLEIASFAYAADCAVPRGHGWSDRRSTEAWGRDFIIVAPVRDIEFWQAEGQTRQLRELLEFLTSDRWAFVFTPVAHDRDTQQYLEFQDAPWPFQEADKVVMFSGGLDSLAGALGCAAAGEKAVLVSHRPVSTMDSRQRQLFQLLKSRFPQQLLRIPVWVNKTHMDSESTQRTRSFLFGALGIAVASVMKGKVVEFYENGVVSLNLPVADEVLRSRASRTTHPIALAQMSGLAESVLGRPLRVENPFLFMTKTEVLRRIAELGGADLIGHSCSCAHSFFKSRQQAHCGTCSQCIDRRIAVLAAGLENCEPAEDYVSDVFLGRRAEGYEQNIAVDYARLAVELAAMSHDEMARRFNLELTRAVQPFERRGDTAERFIDMHARHGAAVYEVIERQLREQSSKLLDGELEATSMLGKIAGGIHKKSNWELYASRLCTALASGLPLAFQSETPRNETHLQEVSDGILKGLGGDLIREYPFLRWSSVLTKPDWSDDQYELLVEAKYVSRREYIRRITDEIAADITKYGDSGQRVVFVIYDPSGYVSDPERFLREVLQRERMYGRVIR